MDCPTEPIAKAITATIFGQISSTSPTLRRALRSALWITLTIPATLSIVCSEESACAQQQPWSQRMANSAIKRWPQGRFLLPSSSWSYELGILLDGMDAVWDQTGNKSYFQYIQQSIDQLVQRDGSIPTYEPQAYSSDSILLGRQLLLLYRVTKDEKYHKAAMLLRKQISDQPRNALGGFWHTQGNPNQMLLDDQYMIDPFYAEYSSTFKRPQDFADITKQFALLEHHTRDPKSGLLYHEWNESRKESWVNKTTGASASFWGRGMGWYVMALVDTLPYYSKDDPGRATLLAILNRTAAGIARHQDRQTGLWYLVLDKPGKKGNYFESSAACMFTYALAKGVRLGYLPKRYSANADRAWQGILKNFVQTCPDGEITIIGTVKGIDLGSAPSHDGSYSYYVCAPVVSNDPKGVGGFLLASTEMDSAATAESLRSNAGR